MSRAWMVRIRVEGEVGLGYEGSYFKAVVEGG